MGYSKSSSIRKIHSYTGLPQETRKIPSKPSNFTHKGARGKKEQAKSTISRRKEIIKIRTEINREDQNLVL